jgi:phosphotransferase system HPr (HPr) family protein
MSDDRCHATLAIVNRLGLHARAAVLLVQAANQFDATVTVSKGDQSVDGRSIMGVMMLAAEQGSSIDVETAGRQAREALDAIATLVANKFNEAE